jgi:hypothetical protein
MNHKDRLTYCQYCKNRVFDSSQGLICSLTKEKASFDTECNDFVKDEKELEKSMMGNGAYRLNSDEETDFIFPFLSNKDKLSIKLDSLKVFKKAIRSWQLYSLFSILVILSLALSNFVEIKIIVVIDLLILIGAFLSLNRKFKENPYIIIDETGINIKNRKNSPWSNMIRYLILDKNEINNIDGGDIPWDNIIRFYFSSFSKKDSDLLSLRTLNKMHIETFGNSEDIRINISACSQNLIKLGKKIQVIKNKNS